MQKTTDPPVKRALYVNVWRKVLARELTAFFLENHIIPMQGPSFLPGIFTFTNLLSKFWQWTLDDDYQQHVDVIYLDFEKSFDKIPISHLIQKLLRS